MTKRATVPETIFFDDQLLYIPTFEEVGIPVLLGMLGTLRPAVKVGQWVNRGDVLIEATYTFYRDPRKTLVGSLQGDPTWTVRVSLLSPVSGIVLALREETVSDHAEWGTTYYLEERVLPILLVPRDEPPQERSRLGFFREIGQNLRAHWRSIPFCDNRGKRPRLSQVVDQHPEDWKAAIDAITRLSELALEEFEIKAFAPEDKDLLATVQSLRASDLALRDKLVHLTKMGAHDSEPRRT